MPERPNADELQRAQAFVADLYEQTSDRTDRWKWGVAYLTPELPKVWDLNLMRLVDPPPDVTAPAIAAEAEELMGTAGCEHRRVWILDEELGAALAPGFEELGWTTDVHVVMVHHRDPDRTVDTSMVEEVGARAWPSRIEQLHGYPWYEPAIDPQMRSLYERITAAANARDFGVVEDGKVVSFALLFSDGKTGQVEDVATLESHRKRGLSRAVVQKALDESRSLHEMTFLVADNRDWPKDFYETMGFDPVGRHYFFLKSPDSKKGGV